MEDPTPTKLPGCSAVMGQNPTQSPADALDLRPTRTIVTPARHRLLRRVVPTCCIVDGRPRRILMAVPGVIDGGGNHPAGNGNPAQCINIDCK
jgi:hypothetical protein